MRATTHRSRIVLAALSMLALVPVACRPPKPAEVVLPPAYTSNRITDPKLHQVAEDIRTWASQQAGAGQRPLYSRVEVLPPVPIVQPYGVGVFQEEVRLPVILTTGPGWAGLKLEEKEAAVVQAFRHFSGLLAALDHEPTLPPTLTVQTPEGIELAWINHLDPSGKHVHGDQ